ncbi:ComEC/Rec2 family competence protein [Marinactinospora rubrisoli]|uniref:ComEC/Rec2 family competence protein n=1 Tax=Marinactinospora rubrisoli TaxID=2715399 RepID=A0ABW2KJP1_9ACTN
MIQLGTDSPDAPRVLDLRLAAPAVGLWLVAFVLLGGTARVAAVVGLVLAVAAVILAPAVRRPSSEGWAAPLVAVLVCASAGAFGVAGRLASVEGSATVAVAAREGRAEMDVVVTSDPRSRAGPAVPGRLGVIVEARTERVVVDGAAHRERVPVVLLVAGEEWRRLVPSQRVRLRGKPVPAGSGELTAALVLVRGPPEEVGPPSRAQALAGVARERLREAASPLPQPERGLVPALVVGDVSRLDVLTAEDFRTAGMTHLLTVSGANLAVLTGVALAVGRWCRWPRWCTVSAGAAMIGIFVLVARPEPSVLRAAFMGTVAIAALALGRERTGIAALAATVVGLLLFDPGLARSYGFALSVLATAGILVLAPRWSERWSARLPRSLADALAVTLAAHLACTPVLVLLAAEVSWVAVPANLAAAPAVPAATVGGFAVAGVALLSPALAGALVWLPGAAVAWIAAVAAVAARTPHAALPWRDDLLGLAGAAVLAVALIAIRGRMRRAVGVVLVVVVLSALVVHRIAPSWPPRGWLLVACDVGQGDAVVLATGAGRAVVVDAGIDPVPVDRCLRRLSVDEVSLLVLTHDDSDHVGGTEGVVRGRTVHAALAPPGFAATATARRLATAQVPLRTGTARLAFTAGPWRFTVLWPRSGAPETGSNDGSIVLHARWTPADDGARAPLTVLLTGDIEEPAQRALLSEPAVHGVDVLKTPHHGARTQEPAFLAAARPRITLTSVGAGNPYGHPAPRTWRLLESLTTANYRTDLHGNVAVLSGPDGPSVAHRKEDDT